MSTNNIQFHDEARKKSLYTFFFRTIGRISLGLKNEFEIEMVNEPSVFELLRFDCSWKIYSFS